MSRGFGESGNPGWLLILSYLQRFVSLLVFHCNSAALQEAGQGSKAGFLLVSLNLIQAIHS